jgi:hypothetical protein
MKKMNSYRGGGTFFDDKRSNQVKAVKYFKKCYFYKLVLGFYVTGTENHLKQSVLEKLLDPTTEHYLSLHTNKPGQDDLH